MNQSLRRLEGKLPKRNDISIKTKYNTKEECMENCRDVKGKPILATTYSRQISGEVFPDGNFVLSSRAKGSSMFEFKGIISEEADGVYMKGDIVKKSSSIRIVYGSILISTLIAIAMVMTMNPVFILFAILFATIPWLNLIIINKSDFLYNDILNKVGS